MSLSRQAERDVPKWTCAVSTKVYIRLTFTFLAETRKRLLLRCRHECYLAPVGFHHYILLVPASHASSAGDMMAVNFTPFTTAPISVDAILLIHYRLSRPVLPGVHRLQLRSTIIYCSVATIPFSGPYSCIFASFSLDAAGTAPLAGAATIHDHSIACVNG